MSDTGAATPMPRTRSDQPLRCRPSPKGAPSRAVQATTWQCTHGADVSGSAVLPRYSDKCVRAWNCVQAPRGTISAEPGGGQTRSIRAETEALTGETGLEGEGLANWRKNNRALPAVNAALATAVTEAAAGWLSHSPPPYAPRWSSGLALGSLMVMTIGCRMA